MSTLCRKATNNMKIRDHSSKPQCKRHKYESIQQTIAPDGRIKAETSQCKNCGHVMRSADTELSPQTESDLATASLSNVVPFPAASNTTASGGPISSSEATESKGTNVRCPDCIA